MAAVICCSALLLSQTTPLSDIFMANFCYQYPWVEPETDWNTFAE